MIILCPTDCEHDLLFQHSIITTKRVVKNPDGSRTQITYTYVTCRECGHWIDHPGLCRHHCHAEDGGTLIVEKELDMV